MKKYLQSSFKWIVLVLYPVRSKYFVESPVNHLQSIYDKLGLHGFDKAQPAFELFDRKHENYKAATYNFDEDIKKKIYSNWKQTFDAFGYEK